MTLCDSEYGRNRLNLGTKYCNLQLTTRDLRGERRSFHDESDMKIPSHPVISWKYAVWPPVLSGPPTKVTETPECNGDSTVLGVLTQFANFKGRRPYQARCKCAGTCRRCQRFGRSAQPSPETVYTGLRIVVSQGVSKQQFTKTTADSLRWFSMHDCSTLKTLAQLIWTTSLMTRGPCELPRGARGHRHPRSCG